MGDEMRVPDDPRQEAVAALERGVAALTERVERLEAEVPARLFTPEQYDDLTRRLQAVRGNAEKDRVFEEWVAEVAPL